MWPDSTGTHELLERARQGEAAAVDALLARHRPAVERMIGLRLDRAIASRVDSSDIVQEVLLEASLRLGDYLRQPAMPFHLWLRHIARDQIIDAHRRHRKAQRRSVDREQPMRPTAPDQSSFELAAAFVDRALTPATEALRREMAGRFQDLLAMLSEEDREVLLMRHFEQLTNQEVAQALGLTEPAAAMRHLRALRRMKALLQPGTETGH